jgi:hypothetical protein
MSRLAAALMALLILTVACAGPGRIHTLPSDRPQRELAPLSVPASESSDSHAGRVVSSPEVPIVAPVGGVTVQVAPAVAPMPLRTTAPVINPDRGTTIPDRCIGAGKPAAMCPAP